MLVLLSEIVSRESLTILFAWFVCVFVYLFLVMSSKLIWSGLTVSVLMLGFDVLCGNGYLVHDLIYCTTWCLI